MSASPDGRSLLADTIRELQAAYKPFSALRVLQAAAAHGGTPLDRHFARQRLRELALDLMPAVGRAWFPVVGAAGGGLVRVDVFLLDAVHPKLVGPEAAHFEPALRAGAELAGEGDLRLVAVLWPHESAAAIDGTSFELAVALAAWSRVTGRALPEHLALSGHVEPAFGVRVPGHLRQKRDVVTEAWGTTGRLISGPSGTPGVEPAANLPNIIHELLGMRLEPPPLGSRLERVAHHRKARAWARVVEAAAGLLADPSLELLAADEAFQVVAQQAQALAHLGRHGEARTTLIEALARFGRRVPGHQRAWAAAVLGVAFIDALHFDDAQAVLDTALAEVTGGDDASRFGRAQLHGTRARLASALGDHARAFEDGQRALQLTRPHERARNLGDLALWHLRAGDPDTAATWLDQAEAALPAAEAVRPAEAAATRDYLWLFRARLHAAQGEEARALELANALIYNENHAVSLGAAELCARLDARPVPEKIDALPDLAPGRPPSVLTRYRARIELARPAPDLARVAAWVGGPVEDPAAVAARLAVQLPY